MLRSAWRSLLHHKLRLILSGVAIVLGVGFVVGTLIFTDTLNSTFTGLFADTTSDVVVTAQQDVQSSGFAGTVCDSACLRAPGRARGGWRGQGRRPGGRRRRQRHRYRRQGARHPGCTATGHELGQRRGPHSLSRHRGPRPQRCGGGGLGLRLGGEVGLSRGRFRRAGGAGRSHEGDPRGRVPVRRVGQPGWCDHRGVRHGNLAEAAPRRQGRLHGDRCRRGRGRVTGEPREGRKRGHGRRREGPDGQGGGGCRHRADHRRSRLRQHLPARVRRHRVVRRQLHHPQHVLDARGAAQP